MNGATRTYWIISIWCILFYSYSLIISYQVINAPTTHCLFKKTFGIPCAGCGGSHAIQAIIRGDWREAIIFNPLVVICFWITTAVGLMVFYDVLFRKKSLIALIARLNDYIKHRSVSRLFAFILILAWLYLVFRYR